MVLLSMSKTIAHASKRLDPSIYTLLTSTGSCFEQSNGWLVKGIMKCNFVTSRINFVGNALSACWDLIHQSFRFEDNLVTSCSGKWTIKPNNTTFPQVQSNFVGKTSLASFPIKVCLVLVEGWMPRLVYSKVDTVSRNNVHCIPFIIVRENNALG